MPAVGSWIGVSTPATVFAAERVLHDSDPPGGVRQSWGAGEASPSLKESLTVAVTVAPVAATRGTSSVKRLRQLRVLTSVAATRFGAPCAR